jgi:hypothetical protein
LDELGFDEPCSVTARRETVYVTVAKKTKPTMRVRIKMKAPAPSLFMF